MHGHHHHHAHSHDSDAPGARHAATRRATLASVTVNVCLSGVQLLAGLVGHSQGLIADGLHSLSDLFADFIVLIANRQGHHPADHAHPYGHGRFETAASLALAILLVLLGAGLLWNGGHRLLHAGPVVPPATATLAIAALTLVSKEGLFRYLIRVANRHDSQLLRANAWHTRSDALSSLVVLGGIVGSLAGWPRLDSAAALLVGLLIGRMGFVIGREALAELVDTALAPAEVEAIRATLLATPGVRAVHELRTRQMAAHGLVDAHVQVDARISVSEGHHIAETARQRVVAAHGALDVLVHIDPEDDGEGTTGQALPDRAAVLAALNAALAPHRIDSSELILHYLDGQVDAEVHLADADPARKTAVQQLAAGSCPSPLRSLSVLHIMH